MQTFVPLADFNESAQVMDLKRLGKQIIECQQIFKSLSLPEYGWKSHPATKMWEGHRMALVKYTKCFNREWFERRGAHHGAYLNLLSIMNDVDVPLEEFALPEWWGRDDVHDSHKSNLVRKLPEHYAKFWPQVPDDIPYVWPR